MKQHMAVASFGQKIAISGGAAAVVGGLTANDLATICGALAALGGLFVQFIFSTLRWRAEQRDKEEEKQQHAQLSTQQEQLNAQEAQRKAELHALEKQRQQLEIQRLRKEVGDEQA